MFSTGETVLVAFSGEGLDPNTPSPNTFYPPDTTQVLIPMHKMLNTVTSYA